MQKAIQVWNPAFSYFMLHFIQRPMFVWILFG